MKTKEMIQKIKQLEYKLFQMENENNMLKKQNYELESEKRRLSRIINDVATKKNESWYQKLDHITVDKIISSSFEKPIQSRSEYFHGKDGILNL